jgi:hypothetical protein
VGGWSLPTDISHRAAQVFLDPARADSVLLRVAFAQQARAADQHQRRDGSMAGTETPKSLRQVEKTLRALLGNDAMFSLVNTRLMLRTGVDLKSIEAAQDGKAELLKQVIQALEKMGYALNGTRSTQ